MKRIVIIGAGFAGFSAVSKLIPYRARLGLDIILISNDGLNFLPLLPDCLGRGLRPESLVFDPMKAKKWENLQLINDVVRDIDLEKKNVNLTNLSLSFDFLIIASGSQTNFYGNDQIKENAFKLDNAKDAELIANVIKDKAYDYYLICGGGYTGIEVATNVKISLEKRRIQGKVIILERASSILGPLPQWVKDYVLNNLRQLNIEVLTSISLDSFKGQVAVLSDGQVLNNAFLVWAAGVRTADFIQKLKVEKNAQGRIIVDKYLRINASCFAAGDAAYFSYKNNFLRMAVQFAIMQGECAANNIVKAITSSGLREYKPLDLGYIIPMANNKACGVVLGINVKGVVPILLHYFMCLFRLNGLKNKFRVMIYLMKGVKNG